LQSAGLLTGATLLPSPRLSKLVNAARMIKAKRLACSYFYVIMFDRFTNTSGSIAAKMEGNVDGGSK
jgi:hypothetical protein